MVKKAEDTIMDFLEGRRKFEFKRVGAEESETYYLAMPSADIIRQSEWEYAKVYNKALKEGIFTQGEMRDLLLKRGILGPDYDTEGQRLQEEITALLIKLEQEDDDSNKRALALEIAKKRNEVFAWNQRVNGPMASTCEQMAEDSKVEYLTTGIVQREDGSLVWETADDYRHDKNFELKVQARLEVMLWMEGLDSDFLKNIPEQRVLAELDKKAEEEKTQPESEAGSDATTDSEVSKEPQTKAIPKKAKVSKRSK